MDSRKGQSTQGGGQGHQYRRTREERRSLSESLADGTSKFFSSMVAKKNGLFSDLSSKIENTFASKPDAVSNSIEGAPSAANTHSVPNTPPPRPPPPKRLPSVGSVREKENMMKRMASMPAYTRTDSRPEFVPGVTRGQIQNHQRNSSEERFSVNGMNVSFDEPIYNKREANSPQPLSDIPASESSSQDVHNATARHTPGPSPPSSQPKPAPRSSRPGQDDDRPAASYQPSARSVSVTGQSSPHVLDYAQGYGQVTMTQEIRGDGRHYKDNKNNNAVETSQQSADSNKLEHERKGDNSKTNTVHERKSDAVASEVVEDQSARQKAPKFTTTKRRSSTVDEMLFDDYVEPEVDEVISKDEPPEDLISFEPDWEAERAAYSSDSSSEGNDHVVPGTSVDSSDAEFGGAPMRRSASVGSEKSWSSCYSVDSQPDDVTLECMEFMKSFVDKVFHNRYVSMFLCLDRFFCVFFMSQTLCLSVCMPQQVFFFCCFYVTTGI